MNSGRGIGVFGAEGGGGLSGSCALGGGSSELYTGGESGVISVWTTARGADRD